MILLHHITYPLTRKNHNRHEVLTTVSQLWCFRAVFSKLSCQRVTWAITQQQPRNQLETPGGAKGFLRGATFFELCPIVSNHVQHIFPGEPKFCWGRKFCPPCASPGYGPAQKLEGRTFYDVRWWLRNMTFLGYVIFYQINTCSWQYYSSIIDKKRLRWSEEMTSRAGFDPRAVVW